MKHFADKRDSWQKAVNEELKEYYGALFNNSLEKLDRVMEVGDSLCLLQNKSTIFNHKKFAKNLFGENTIDEMFDQIEGWYQWIAELLGEPCFELEQYLEIMGISLEDENSLLSNFKKRDRLSEQDQVIMLHAFIIAPIIVKLERLENYLATHRRHEISNPEVIKLLQYIGDECDKKANGFKFRYEKVEELKNQIQSTLDEEKGEGTYLLFTGREGSGKTTTICKLVQSWIERSPVNTPQIAPWLPNVIIHFGKRSRDIKLIVQSIIEQANTFLTKSISMPDIRSKEDHQDQFYQTLFHDILKKIVEEKKEIILILDALDEIGKERENFRFLPEFLPKGVVLLLTARTNSAAARIVNGNLKRVQPLNELEQFTTQEITTLLDIQEEDSKGHKFVKRVIEKTTGLPELVFRIQNDLVKNNMDYDTVKILNADEYHREKLDKSLEFAPDRRVMELILLLLAIFEPIRSLNSDLVYSFLRSLGFSIDKYELEKTYFNTLSEQIESIEKIKLESEAYAKFILNHYKVDLYDHFVKVVAWLKRTPEFCSDEDLLDLFSEFLYFWSNESLLNKEKYISNRNLNRFVNTTQKVIECLEEDKWGANLLYSIYLNHLSQKSLIDVSADCLKKAAHLGDPQAIFDYGNCLLKGRGVIERDAKEARVWLEKAATLKDSWSLYLGEELLCGNVSIHNPVAGEKWLREAAEKLTEARLLLAKYLLDGFSGVQQRPSEGLNLLEQLVDQGDKEATLELARRKINGNMVDRNPTEGKQLLKRLVKLGFPEANQELGIRLLDGKGLQQNTGYGRSLLFKARYNPSVRLEIGIRQLEGKGFKLKLREGKKILRGLAKRNNRPAMLKLSDRLFSGEQRLSSDPIEARTLLIKAVNSHYRLAKLKMAQRLLDGDSWKQNCQRGEEMLRKLAEDGLMRAMHELGKRLLAGNRGIPINLEEGEYWLNVAAHRGFLRAILDLANHLLDGQVFKPNPQKGKEWLERAVQHGYQNAMLELAKRLLEGNGMDENIVHGEKLLRQAADMGHVESKLELAARLKEGNKINRNINEAKKLIREANQLQHLI